MPKIYIKEYDTTVNFPDTMGPEEIRNVLSSKFPPKIQQPREKEIAVPEWAKESPGVYGALGATAEVGGPIAEAVGLGAGGVLGAPAGPAGAVGGAGLGFAAGKNLKDFLEELVGKRPKTTIGQELTELPAEIAAGAAYEMAGQAAGKSVEIGLKKLIQPFKQSLTPGLTSAERELQKAGGVGFSPAQKTDNAIIDTLEEVGERSFSGSQTFKKFRLKQQAGIENYIQSVTDKMSRQVGRSFNIEERGILLRSMLEEGSDVFNATGRALYKNVDDLTGLASVNITPLHSMANRIQSEQARGVISSGKLNTILDNVLNKPARVTFAEGQAIRSDLLAVTRQIDELIPGRAEGAAKRLASIMDRAMEESARPLSGDALQAWRAANKFWKSGKETFNNKFIKTLMQQLEKEPAVVINKVFQNGRPNQVRRIKNIVNKQTWDALREGYLEKLIVDSSSVDAQLIGKTFLGKMGRGGRIDPMIKEVFSPAELSRIRNIGVIANTVQKPIGGGGGMLIQLAQGASIATFIGSYLLPEGKAKKGARAASLLILLGPYALSKLMTHPKYHALFAQGLRTPRVSPKAIELTTKLSSAINEIGLEPPKARKEDKRELMHPLSEISIHEQQPKLQREPMQRPQANRLQNKFRDIRIAN